MAKFKKPIITHIPKPVRGEFGVPPFYPFYCPYHDIRFKTAVEYNQHMAKYHPDEVGVGLPKLDEAHEADSAQALGSDLSGKEGTKNPRDLFPYEEQQAIDEGIEYFDYLNKEFDLINKECDNQLKDLAIPYDREKLAELYQACICPDCGQPGVGAVITANSFSVQTTAEKSRNKVLFSHSDPDNIGYKSPSDIYNEYAAKFRSMIKMMLRGIWNQIIIWVLSYIYTQLRPLSRVPYAKKIPQKIKAAIDALKNSQGLSLKAQMKNMREASKAVTTGVSDDEYEKAFEEAYSDIAPVSTIGEISTELRLYNCIKHKKEFDLYANGLVREKSPKHVAWLAMRQANEAQIQNIRAMQQVASSRIPDGYETPSGIKFKANLPEEYLKARADGSTKFSDLWTGKGLVAAGRGTKDVFNTVKDSYIKAFKDGMKSWVMSPTFLCCILRIITQIGALEKYLEYEKKVGEGKRFLLMVKGLLEMLLNILTFDLNKSAVELANFIITLVNALIQKIFSAMGQVIDSGINKYALQSKELTKYKAFGRECLPWFELTGTLGFYLDKFFKELGAYLASLMFNGRLSALKSKKITDDAWLVLKVESWIRMIDKILGFMKFWEICLENTESATDEWLDNMKYSSKQSRWVPKDDWDETLHGDDVAESPYMTSMLREIIRKDKKVTTVYMEKPVIGIESGKRASVKVLSEDEKEALRQAGEFFKHVEPWSLDGVKVLLTNFMGYTPQEASRIVDPKGECNCDKILSDTELQAIRETLEEKVK